MELDLATLGHHPLSSTRYSDDLTIDPTATQSLDIDFEIDPTNYPSSPLPLSWATTSSHQHFIRSEPSTLEADLDKELARQLGTPPPSQPVSESGGASNSNARAGSRPGIGHRRSRSYQRPSAATTASTPRSSSRTPSGKTSSKAAKALASGLKQQLQIRSAPATVTTFAGAAGSAAAQHGSGYYLSSALGPGTLVRSRSNPQPGSVDVFRRDLATTSIATVFGHSPISSPSQELPSPPLSISPTWTINNSRPAMPAGRLPSKRSVEWLNGGDSPGSGDSMTGKSKQSKTERAQQEDFSSVVKNRLQSFTRTGQACDRCKVRKIRCDALPEGCSHCVNLNLECYVTDRVTGRTERRGYMQQLEREKNGMLAHIRDMEKILSDRGIEVKVYQAAKSSSPDGSQPMDHDSDDGKPHSATASSQWTHTGTHESHHGDGRNNMQQFSQNLASRLQLLLNPKPTSTKLDEDFPVAIRGTKHEILGCTLDTMALEPPDMKEPDFDTPDILPIYNKSLRSFLRTVTRVQPAPYTELPPREEAFNYCEWYFLSTGQFLPILHKPSFLKVLARCYDEPGFQPPVPQQVCIHVVLGSIYFDYGTRNWDDPAQRDQLIELSNKHFHFALSKVFELMSSEDIAALQALALLCAFARQFPKPACANLIHDLAMSRAVAMGIHRRQDPPQGHTTNLQLELRKRVWWAILTLIVSANGRQGIPIPIGVSDFDQDYPEMIADELLSDEGVDTSKTLDPPFLVGAYAYRTIALRLEIYNHLNSVRPNPETYAETVEAFEAQICRFEEMIPERLRLESSDPHDPKHFAALYGRIYSLQNRMSLYQPMPGRTNDRALFAKHMAKVEDVSKEYLEVAKALQRFRALDPTWFSLSFHVSALHIMLVMAWHRRFEMTTEKVADLRADMDAWISICKESHTFFSTGLGMSNDVSRIVEHVIEWIERDMHSKDHPNPPANMGQHSQSTHPNKAANKTKFRSSGGIMSNSKYAHDTKPLYQNVNPKSQPYDSATFADRPHTGMPSPSYEHDANTFYGSSQHMTPPVQAGSVFWQHQQDQQQRHPERPAPQTWHSWHHPSMPDSQDRYSANALLDLGNGGRGGAAGAQHGSSVEESAVMTDAPEIPGPQTQAWPSILFSEEQEGSHRA